ncbi:TetR family transcriptional regulator [Vibrio navarrensis]|uniref:TetR/AcrR family transcriptional regulator n=1 Tax=Vibrio navarrensis TaxID=29495 RepID=A0AAJ4IFH2_9VIBR|nr:MULTISPECIES: TetR/AcrR family transcriptional regulator [Vibrio]KJR28890.1 transcriptional regulator [Vibrio sp. S234-5]MBE3651815.1 TetR family transcriptional regulator [Vibrio navarrensis]MBE3655978.1 TetR family transcriptional regulator [Vibrio navarrensis]MBE3660375.1 TetR family transcriptional regulator [Vibrio navarrensis]MBE3668436.1 TetR family transcriptional regulator [Vibrio navarrensis]
MSQKRQLLVDTALALFYANGINSIGINEVLTVSGVAKRTLYSHFPSKEALVLAALQQRHQIFASWLEQKIAVASSDSDLIARLFHALENWFTHQEPQLGTFRGCFFINTSAEFSDLDSEIARFCLLHKQQVRAIISHHLQSKNPLLLDAICLLKEGAIVTAHLSGNSEQVTEQCIQILGTFEV